MKSRRLLALVTLTLAVPACAGNRELERLPVPLEPADSARLMEWADRRSAEVSLGPPSGRRESMRGALRAVTERGSVLVFRVDGGERVTMPVSSVEQITFPRSDLAVAATSGVLGAMTGLGLGLLVGCGLVGCSGDDDGFALEMSAIMGATGVLLGLAFGDDDPPGFQFQRDPGSP
ncbi:MAG: hypothetical protein R3253_15405 [Longimicrobiales bacterium]|nr:hypothetical protein [Longimicrobiales bacterium]